MKAIVYLSLTLSFILSATASAAVWPERLSDLPYADRIRIEDKQLAGFSVFDFKFLSQQSTIDGHSIVFYGVENVLAICDDGIASTNSHYLSLYVDENDQIKHVTNFSNFGCR